MFKDIIIYFLLISISGTILHFTYKLSKNNVVVGIFSSVNESVWEHIKLYLTPIFSFNTLYYIFISKDNYFIGLMVELLIAIFLTILLYKIKLFFFKDSHNYLNIVLFYIVCLIISISRYNIKRIYFPNGINTFAMFISLIIFIFYLTFTVFPPKKELFLDPLTKKYGIK